MASFVSKLSDTVSSEIGKVSCPSMRCVIASLTAILMSKHEAARAALHTSVDEQRFRETILSPYAWQQRQALFRPRLRKAGWILK